MNCFFGPMLYPRPCPTISNCLPHVQAEELQGAFLTPSFATWPFSSLISIPGLEWNGARPARAGLLQFFDMSTDVSSVLSLYEYVRVVSYCCMISSDCSTLRERSGDFADWDFAIRIQCPRGSKQLLCQTQRSKNTGDIDPLVAGRCRGWSLSLRWWG